MPSWTWWTCRPSCPDCCGCWSPAGPTGSRSTTTARASSCPATPTTTRSCRPTTGTWMSAFAMAGRPGKAGRAAACSTTCGLRERPRWRRVRRTGSYPPGRMGTTRAMRLTSCAASLTRSRTRCETARTGWNRRTWPTGWPSAAGNWLRASWSISPTSLISLAARPASAPPAPGEDGPPCPLQLPQPGRHRLPQRNPPAVPLEGELEHSGEQTGEAYGHGQQDRGQHEECRRPGGDVAQYQAVRHSDDDRQVRQVEAVGAGAEAPRQAAVQETDDGPRARGGDRGEEAADRWSPGQIEPEQIEVRPHGALDPHQRDDRHRGGQRVTGPGPGPSALTGGDDPGGQQADGEQHREVGGELDQSAVHQRDMRPQQADGHDDGGHEAHHHADTRPPDEQQQQRQQDVELDFDGDRPERFVGGARGEGVLHEQAVHHDGLPVGHGPAGLGEHVPGHKQTEYERGPVGRQDAPGPSLRVRPDRLG